MLMLSFLSLHSAGAVAAHELFHIGNADTVKVADDAVLQAAGRDCKLERRLLVLIVVQAVDQAACKRVAAAHAVDNVPNFVLFGHIKSLPSFRHAAQPFQSALWLSRSVMAMHFMFG